MAAIVATVRMGCSILPAVVSLAGTRMDSDLPFTLHFDFKLPWGRKDSKLDLCRMEKWTRAVVVVLVQSRTGKVK